MKYKRILANHCESLLIPRTNRHINVYKAHLLSVRCNKVKHCMAWYFECRHCVHNNLGERLWDNYES
jgi:RNase P subunit RPR2